MRQKRLTALSLLTIESEVVKEIDFGDWSTPLVAQNHGRRSSAKGKKPDLLLFFG